MARALGVVAAEATARTRCEVWGVLNVTPDSFSDGGRFLTPERALEHAARMQAEGADVIDVGGASSRPPGALYGQGAAEVPADEELRRVLPVVRGLCDGAAGPARVSVDTVSARVARASIEAGASIINDVSCASSPALLDVVASGGVDYVLMHTRGRGEVTPANTRYHDVVREVCDELQAALQRALACGVQRRRIWLDPGLGFAKTPVQSLCLLAHTEALLELGQRVLLGPSRKGFIAQAAPRADGEAPAPAERDAGTAAAVTVAALKGAHAVRVHDVAAMRQAVLLAEAMRAAGEQRP